MNPIRTIIVDDEAEAREGVKRLLAKDPDIQLVDSCKNGLEAIQKINTLQPALVFLDIQMPQINGFEVLHSLPPDRIPKIVFITAYDQYALKAFELHAIDYLLKPFTDERFFDCLTHVKQHLSHRSAEEQRDFTALLHNYFHQNNEVDNSQLIHGANSALDKRLVIKSGGKIHFVNYKDIIWIEAHDYYIKIHIENTYFLMRESMKAMEQKLPSQSFVRIHKSSIVNMDYVVELEPFFNGEYHVKLKGGQTLKLSRTYRENLLGKLDM